MSAWSMLASAFCRGRRVPRTGYKQLTSKVGPRTFYKGKGCAPTGRHTKKGEFAEGCLFAAAVPRRAVLLSPSSTAKLPVLTVFPSMLFDDPYTGGYIVEPEKLPQYIVPDLTGFEVCAGNIKLRFSAPTLLLLEPPPRCLVLVPAAD